MKIHIFEHAHFESAGNIVDIAKDKKHKISYTKFYKDFKLPNINDFELLIIMGAPMSVHDEKEFPWLIEEKKYIKQVIESGKKVLGICFGSQLIAEALGAKVYSNTQKEIGWYNIHKDKNSNSPFLSNFNNNLLTFHWHGDTYDLPEGSLPIFSSAATKNQGFTFGRNVVALQFHWEMTKEIVELLIQHSGNDITIGKFVQTPEDLLANIDGFKSNNKHITHVLEYFNK